MDEARVLDEHNIGVAFVRTHNGAVEMTSSRNDFETFSPAKARELAALLNKAADEEEEK